MNTEKYARPNNSFGLTAVRRRHVKVEGTALVFDFRAKHGIGWRVEIKDHRLANGVRKLQDLMGQDLFNYADDKGRQRNVGSDDVNDYLPEITRGEIRPKDSRIWAATNLAALALREFEAFDRETKAKKNVLRAIEAVAKILGNASSICRKCYNHPAIFEHYLDGSLLEGPKPRADALLPETTTGLTAEELGIRAYLDRRARGGASSK